MQYSEEMNKYMQEEIPLEWNIDQPLYKDSADQVDHELEHEQFYHEKQTLYDHKFVFEEQQNRFTFRSLHDKQRCDIQIQKSDQQKNILDSDIFVQSALNQQSVNIEHSDSNLLNGEDNIFSEDNPPVTPSKQYLDIKLPIHEHRYIRTRRGTSKQTKSLHEQLKTIFLTEMQSGSLKMDHAQDFLMLKQKYKSNTSFKTMRKLFQSTNKNFNAASYQFFRSKDFQRKINKSKMTFKNKLTFIKYMNVIQTAPVNPQAFSRWKQ